MSPSSVTASHRTMRAVLAAGIACLISGLTVVFATLLPSASADHEEPQVVAGNPDCEDLDLEFLDKVEFDGDQPTIIDDITELFNPEDYDLDIVAVIVKGGNNANVYDVPPFHDLVAPDGKEISHIEICGGEVKTTTTTSPPTTTTSPPTTTTSPPPTTPAREELPKTGSGNGWLAALGAGLLLGGAGLVLAGRQAGRHEA